MRANIDHLDLGIVWVQSVAADPAVRSAIASAAGIDLPTQPLTATGDLTRAALWIAPDQWWLIAPRAEAPALAARMAAEMPTVAAWVQAVSAGWRWRRLSRARDVLAAGSPLDFHPRAFQVGQVARSLLGKVDATIWHVERDVFAVATEASLDGYVGRWLDEINERGG